MTELWIYRVTVSQMIRKGTDEQMTDGSFTMYCKTMKGALNIVNRFRDYGTNDEETDYRHIKEMTITPVFVCQEE